MHFSDESKFLLIGSDGKTYVRRKVGEELSPKCLKTSVKFVGGIVMVWGMKSGDGVGPLMRLQGKVNAGVYKQLVKDHALPVLRNSTKQPYIYIYIYIYREREREREAGLMGNVRWSFRE